MQLPIAMSSRAATAVLLIAVLAGQPAFAAFWTVTTMYQYSTIVSQYRTYTDDVYTLRTSYRIKDGVTPTVSPTSTATYSNRAYDLMELTLWFATGAVAPTDLITTSASRTTTSVYTTYAIPAVYTAPASCPTPFTYTTHTVVGFPTAVYSMLSATSTAVSVGSGPTPTSYVTLFVDPTAYPLTRTPGTSDNIYRYYVGDCSNPATTQRTTSTTTRGGGSTGGGGGTTGSNTDDDYWLYCSLINGCTGIPVWAIVLATVLPSLFIFGFLESWFWFRALMLGKPALRVGTICWAFLGLIMLAFTRRSGGRSPEDQARLRAQWYGMSGGTKFKLWWKWGFRWAYPTALLGPDPKDPTGPGIDAPVMQGPPPSMTGPPAGFVSAYTQSGMPPAPGQFMGYQPYPQAYPVSQNSSYDPKVAEQQMYHVPPLGQTFTTPPPGQQQQPYMTNGALPPLPHESVIPHEQNRDVSPVVSSIQPQPTTSPSPPIPSTVTEPASSTTAPTVPAAPPSELSSDPKGKAPMR